MPVRLLHGSLDPFVPLEQSTAFSERAKSKGDDAEVWLIEGAGHFDLIAPFAPAAMVERAVISLLFRPVMPRKRLRGGRMGCRGSRRMNLTALGFRIHHLNLGA